MDNDAMFTRLKEYRIDFAFTLGNYYAASQRLKKLYKKKEKFSQYLNIIAAGLGIMSLTALQLFIINTLDKNFAVLFASGMSFVSVIIAMWLFFHKNPDTYISYHNRAEDYLILYKQVKDSEAQYVDGKLTSEQLAYELVRLNAAQERINMVPLTDITDEDYKKTVESINNGSRTYSELDFKNT